MRTHERRYITRHRMDEERIDFEETLRASRHHFFRGSSYCLYACAHETTIQPKRGKAMANVKKWEENDHWVEIDLDRCRGVAECVNVCPSGVYTLREGKVVAENIGGCAQCSACQDSCPNNAILKHSAWE